jgi:ABC-type multidrug transport system ATPase subunit
VTVRQNGVVMLPPVDLDVAAGQITLVTGQNGVGKTTLLRVLAGQLRPSGGTVVVCGMAPDRHRAEFRRRVAHMLSPRPFSSTMTVAEHIDLAAMTWGCAPDTAAGVRECQLRRFDLAGLANRFPHQLSLGQSQAASLCVTLARPFDLLLLDEPDHALDDGRLRALERVMRENARRGAAVVVATHSRALRTSMADQVIELAELRHDTGA